METHMIMDAVSGKSGIENGVLPVSGAEQINNIVGESEVQRYINAMPRKPKQKVKSTPKIGRNEPCPCGSGKKYKHCCLSSGKYEPEYINA
jgi:preprotein translocase subunit SecA